MSTVGDRIKLRRSEKSLPLAELARRVSISKGYLHSIENGDTQSPSAEILFKIANELGTTIADLLGEQEQISKFDTINLADIPSSLREFARQDNLPEADVEMLAHIQYRGKQPESVDDWRYIYESIKRTLR